MIMKRWWFNFNISYPLTVLGGILFLILGTIAASACFRHLTLETQTEAVIDQWKVIKKSSSAYPIRGKYHFEFQGKTYQGSSIILPPYHLNRPSAKRAVVQLEKEKWNVWLDPRNPSISMLQKESPLKKIVYALVALGITLYFGYVETTSKIRSPMN
jgi:hypothetical protein